MSAVSQILNVSSYTIEWKSIDHRKIQKIIQQDPGIWGCFGSYLTKLKTLFLGWCLGITPGRSQGQSSMLWVKSGSVISKARVLSIVYLSRPLFLGRSQWYLEFAQVSVLSVLWELYTMPELAASKISALNSALSLQF